MIDIDKEILDLIKDTNHYLLMGMHNHREYHEDFKRALSFLLPKLNKPQTEYLLANKLQISDGSFNEKPFIQSACETTVCASLAEKYPSAFKYEVKLNPNSDKNVECQFEDSGFMYNVEVKCPDFGARESTLNKDAFKFISAGRIPNYKEDIAELSALLMEGQRKSGDAIKPISNVKNMDNNLKDFLYSAHDKFSSTSKENEVNVLLVGCDDSMDMQSWHHYLHAEMGLFTTDSFAEIDKYRRVDIVALTNLYHRHHKYFRKTRLSNFWKLDDAFTILSCNQFRLADKKDAILHFANTIRNYANELANYQVPGNAESYVMDALRVFHFIHDELETKRGIVHFEREAKSMSG